MQEKELSRVQGSLIGGAAGDALGYVVEFMPNNVIRKSYGPEGITEYDLTEGKALFSDDTQMTLFTANGLLSGETMHYLRGTSFVPVRSIAAAYLDWLYTQDPGSKPANIRSWLVDIPELHSRRAPGNTCISALSSYLHRHRYGLIDKPLNNSCGCGGVMRTAPVGLFFGPDCSEADLLEIVRLGAEAAAITHGHPWGYIPAGMLSLIVNRAAFTDDPLPEIIRFCLKVTGEVFSYDDYWGGFVSFIEQAAALSGNDAPDQENIRKLGEGWVGHEALAIAVYAALRYEHDFSSGIIAAVNHDGDSDSTGAICGNILGAYLGMEDIAAKWTDTLELKETILEIGRDLYVHSRLVRSPEISNDPQWLHKYAGTDRKDRSETAGK